MIKLPSTRINIGVRIFPTRSTNLVGFKDNQKVKPKKIRVYRSNGVPVALVASFKKGTTPISKATVPVLGIPKNGPMARYRHSGEYESKYRMHFGRNII